MKTLSYQLYSSRKFPPMADTLAMLAGIGYAQVEGFEAIYEDPAALRAAMDANGLTMPSGHFGLEDLEQNIDGAMTTARILGMETIYCPYLKPQDRPSDAAGYAAIGARLRAAGDKVRDAGFKFGWHNHDFEFVALADGSIPMTILFDAAPDMEWEADLAWVIKGGADPLAWINDYASRISAVHIKDIAAEGECVDEDGWADVGHGTVDWAALYAACQNTAVRYYIMEHDNPSDDRRFAERSFAAVQAI